MITTQKRTVSIYKDLKGNFGTKRVFIARGKEEQPGVVRLDNGRRMHKGSQYIWKYWR